MIVRLSQTSQISAVFNPSKPKFPVCLFYNSPSTTWAFLNLFVLQAMINITVFKG